MTANQFQTEWIVAHLLFPNSAQAKDVYFFAVTQFVRKNNLNQNSKRNIIFFKIFFELFKKTKIVQSGFSFSEFADENFKAWPKSYRKLSKEEILIIIAIVSLNLSTNEIAQVLKVSPKQVEVKFIQTIHKLIPKPTPNQAEQHQFKYKTIHENRRSDYNLCDEVLNGVFGFGSMTEALVQDLLKRDSRIPVVRYYEALKTYKDELSLLESRTYNLPNVNFAQEIKTKSHFLNIKNLALFLPTSFVALTILILLFLRPQFIQDSLLISKKETIEIQQIKIDRHIDFKEDIEKDLQKLDQLDSSETLVKTKVENENRESNTNNSKQTATLHVDKKIAPISGVKTNAKTKPDITSAGLFRGRLLVTDIQQVLNVVREKIISSGGKKAGDVELGWMKNESTSYFHFSFPEALSEDLENNLKQFGKVKFVFEPHPRIMPAGTRRYILEIKQNE